MKLEPVMVGVSEDAPQREMDGLLCFYADASLYITIRPETIQESRRLIDGGAELCDWCAIAMSGRETGAPYCHVYGARAWHAMPVPAKDGGREVVGHPGTWAMLQFDFRTSTKKVIDQFDAAVIKDEPVTVELIPMRESQRSGPKKAYIERTKEPGYTKRPYRKNGKYARPEGTRIYAGRSNH